MSSSMQTSDISTNSMSILLTTLEGSVAAGLNVPCRVSFGCRRPAKAEAAAANVSGRL